MNGSKNTTRPRASAPDAPRENLKVADPASQLAMSGWQAGKPATLTVKSGRGGLFGRVLIAFDRRAGANQIAVAIHVVDPADRWPVFVDSECSGWETALFARVFPRPVCNQILDGMGRMTQRAILGTDLAPFHGADFFADRQQCGDKTVNLGLGFAFSRLDHQGSGYWPAHGWRMKTVINQPFGNIVHRDADLGKRAGVQNAFMRHPAFVAHEQDRVTSRQTSCDVVGVQNRNPGCLRQSLATHQKAVSP